VTSPLAPSSLSLAVLRMDILVKLPPFYLLAYHASWHEAQKFAKAVLVPLSNIFHKKKPLLRLMKRCTLILLTMLTRGAQRPEA